MNNISNSLLVVIAAFLASSTLAETTGLRSPHKGAPAFKKDQDTRLRGGAAKEDRALQRQGKQGLSIIRDFPSSPPFLNILPGLPGFINFGALLREKG